MNCSALALALLFGVGPLGVSAQETSNTFEVQEHTLFEITAEVDVPDGKDIIDSDWHIEYPSGDHKLDYRGKNNKTILGTGVPTEEEDERYTLRFTATIAETGKDENGKPFAYLPYQKVEKVYYLRIIPKMPRPPPEPEEPDKPNPEDGPRSAKIIWDSDKGPLPPSAEEAAAILNETDTKVQIVEKDTKTGTGEVPRQHTKSLNAAKQLNNYPALVIKTGEEIYKTIPLPRTTQAIVDAVRGEDECSIEVRYIKQKFPSAIVGKLSLYEVANIRMAIDRAYIRELQKISGVSLTRDAYMLSMIGAK